MAYVYAVVFKSGIVKIGRSGDPWKRISNHVSDGKRYDHTADLAFIAQVDNEVKVEQQLLEEAYDIMDDLSQESFKMKSVGDVVKCFDRCRLGYMVFRVGRKPYRLIMSEDTFRFQHGLYSVDNVGDDPASPVKKGIAKSVMGKEGVGFDYIKSGNRQRRIGDLKSCLLDMEKSGHIKIDRWKNPFHDTISNDLEKAKYHPTVKTYIYTS